MSHLRGLEACEACLVEHGGERVRLGQRRAMSAAELRQRCVCHGRTLSQSCGQGLSGVGTLGSQSNSRNQHAHPINSMQRVQ
eukprot:2884055-Amphidinium_carterae.1